MEITEREMHSGRKEIRKKETYNPYGDSARKVEISALEEQDTFIRVRQRGAERESAY